MSKNKFQPVVKMAKKSDKAVPIIIVTEETVAEALARFGAAKWASAHGYSGQEGMPFVVPGEEGIAAVLFHPSQKDKALSLSTLEGKLPEGDYQIEGLNPETYQTVALFWQLNSYEFSHYKKPSDKKVRLLCPDDVDLQSILAEAEAVCLGRDLINTPANDLGTEELTSAIEDLAKKFKAKVKVISGDDLLAENFPMIHAVGRASPRAPALVDLTWGKKSDPKVTLVGKGIVFDTGGLDIKPSPAMLLMKKDMGGSAAAIAAAFMIMAAKLPVRLRLLVPTAENAIAGNAFRPGDILPSRLGDTVEIGNTDAEGRLVLADALALGDEESPDLMVSFATLTGAARVALGADLPPLYSTVDDVAHALQHVGDKVADPMWHMPLYAPYKKLLSSDIADINHVSSGGFAGSITAALFLAHFVKNAGAYVHLDIYGWNPTARPGVPKGGEVHCARALYHYVKQRFGHEG